MIKGSSINMRVVDENGAPVSTRGLCISRIPEARPHAGEFVWAEDGMTKYLVVSGEWGLLDEAKKCYGFKLTLRAVEVNTGKLKWVKE